VSIPSEISVIDLAVLLRDEPETIVVDCREPFEHEMGVIEGSILMPMGEIPGRLEAWKEWQNRRMIVVCHHGVRSLHVTHFLRAKGFRKAQSLRGGIDAWSEAIDPSIPKY
jgi:rhodanese-related sulfurtransferase